jgi:excisionase family DNA binding protein
MEITKEKPNPINLITVNDYSKVLGVNRRTVYNMINDGRIKQVDFLGKKWIDKSTFKLL